MIAGAAADVALEFVADRVLVQGLALALHHVDGRHDHARRAEAALQAVVFAEGFLHRMQFAVLGQAFDGGNCDAVAGCSQCGAGL